MQKKLTDSENDIYSKIISNYNLTLLKHMNIVCNDTKTKVFTFPCCLNKYWNQLN